MILNFGAKHKRKVQSMTRFGPNLFVWGAFLARTNNIRLALKWKVFVVQVANHFEVVPAFLVKWGRSLSLSRILKSKGMQLVIASRLNSST